MSCPPEVLPWRDDPFISDPRVVTAVIDDQVLCALTLQVADDGMAVLMLPGTGTVIRRDTT